MENEKIPLYVAFSTPKGGIGKTTFIVLAASYLYYLKGYDVALVDCDYPKHSIAGMRKRDGEQVGADEDYKRMAYEQFTRLGKKAYPVLCSSPKKTIATADGYVAAEHVSDIVFFDLTGTVNSEKSLFFGIAFYIRRQYSFQIIKFFNFQFFQNAFQFFTYFIPFMPQRAIKNQMRIQFSIVNKPIYIYRQRSWTIPFIFIKSII